MNEITVVEPSCALAPESARCASLQEAPLHQKLHPPQPLLLLRPEGRGRAGEGRHPLQPNLAVLQPAVTGEFPVKAPGDLTTRRRRSSLYNALCEYLLRTWF